MENETKVSKLIASYCMEILSNGPYARLEVLSRKDNSKHV